MSDCPQCGYKPLNAYEREQKSLEVMKRMIAKRVDKIKLIKQKIKEHKNGL